MTDTTVVPAGHEVTLFSMAVEPGVHMTAGNVIVANLGIAGDDGDRELDEIVAAVERLLPTRAEAMLVDHTGPLALGDLFAPNELKTTKVQSPITWVLHDGSVISTMARPSQRTTLIAFMHRLAREGIKQAVYFIDPPVEAVASFAQHMIGIGVVMRQPDDSQDGELAVQIEIKRPDGVFTVLAGTETPLEGLARVYQPDSLVGLAPQVIAMRVEKLEIKDPPIAFRAPKLRKRILDRANAPMEESFIDELVARDLPLFLLERPGSDDLSTRVFGAVKALPAYVDAIGVHWTAADLELAPGAYTVSAADPRPLLEHLVEANLGLAIGTFRNRATPIYAVLPPEVIAAAAKRVRAL